ncbi:hypothetical protein LINPERHAP2_LOCUS9517, partial [Linum perenne]
DYYITVGRWSPEFNEDALIQKILTWIRLPKLRIQFFNHMVVERIGNHIGRTVRLHLATSEGARVRYARVCVEVDLSKPLLGKYIIEDKVFLIEYESLDNICYSCGMYGHKVDGCPKKPFPETVPAPEKDIRLETHVPEEVKHSESDGNYVMNSRRTYQITTKLEAK